MAKKLTQKVSWVGKIDWELKHFHGDELSTHKGSSYNSYLIRDEKVTLIDTVWQPYDREFVSRLKQEIDLSKIDYIIMNHNEIDHSGALPELMRHIPDTPIYCTKKGEAIIRGHYHQDWNFVNVKTGDTLSLGETTLTFVEMTMMHWPDSMLTYMDTDGGIVFSNDAFGQHYATESLYNDAVCEAEVMYEAEKYYANILNPFNAMVSKKIPQIEAMNLPITLICPSHGVIWKNNPAQIIEKYKLWSAAYQEDQVTIVYDTMWQSTRKMAQAIADGIREASSATTVKIMNINRDDKNDVLTEMWRSKAVLVGSPTINNGHSFAIAGLMEMAAGLKFKNKKAAAFGSYGWGGGSVKQISAKLEEAGFTLVNEGLAKLWVPDETALDDCRAYGRDFAQALG
ncbi:MAG: anaerobic nitric oxide reductase flavorubredoxin [Prevotella sp.]|nr:anaerobic nitric oxide reductase flavorubredoxin [Prevotella sp.]